MRFYAFVMMAVGFCIACATVSIHNALAYGIRPSGPDFFTIGASVAGVAATLVATRKETTHERPDQTTG